MQSKKNEKRTIQNISLLRKNLKQIKDKNVK